MNRTIRISTADKGGAVVVQNTEDYVAEAHRQLYNTQHYEKLERNPTARIARESNSLAHTLFKGGHIDEHTLRWAEDKKSSGLKAEGEKNHDHHPVSVDQVCKSGMPL
ncbi:hypothetical protein ACOMHN_028603 [Nucella lapillus]